MGDPGSCNFLFNLDTLYAGHRQASARLTAAFTDSEALHVVRSMNRCSAPGPDGFGPSFYVAAWNEIKSEVMAFLHAFHEGSVQLDRINRSFMVLLPKKPGAISVDAFRPICLKIAVSR